MSTIKSSDEHLTLNADGSSKDIKFQANGVEKASISSSGAFTSTTIDATKLTGTIPNFTSTGIDDNADATAITISSAENVGIGATSPSTSLHLKDNATGANTKLTVERSSLSYTGEYAASHCGSVTNNEFEIHTNNTLRVKIDSTGRVTMPNQPSFAAFRSSGTWNASVSDIMIHNGEDYDVGNNHNTTTGKFTAPVAGKYLINFWAMTNDDAAYIDHHVAIRINGTHHKRIYSSSRAADHHQWSWSGVISLAANDYVDIGGGDVKFYGSDGYYSHFGGHLLG